MSNTETVAVEDGANAVEEAPEVVVEVEAHPEAKQVSPTEVRARTKGWLPADELKEKFETNGKDFDADMVVSAHQFIKNGEMISKMKQLERQVKNSEQALIDNNAINKVQLDLQRADLEVKRDEAIDDADRTTVNKIDKQIAGIDKQTTAIDAAAEKVNQVSEVDTLAENDYFGALSRGHQPFAKQVAGHFINQGLAGNDLVEAVKSEMSKEFPPINQRRENAPATEVKARKAKSKDDSIMSVDSLSAQDRSILQALQGQKAYANKSTTELLKILGDSKK